MAGGSRYTSGDWRVKHGREKEFIACWTDFVSWAETDASGAEEFFLIQQADDPRRFISFGRRRGQDAIDAWRGGPEFGEGLGRCRGLCDDFSAKDFQLVAQVGGE